MTAQWLVVCGDEGWQQSFGPFDTRFDAQADLDILQGNRLTCCEYGHVVMRAEQVPDSVPLFPPRTTERERIRHLARVAASRSAR